MRKDIRYTVGFRGLYKNITPKAKMLIINKKFISFLYQGVDTRPEMYYIIVVRISTQTS